MIYIEFTNDNLIKIKEQKKCYNERYSRYFYRMYKEYNEPTFLDKSRRINTCMDFWLWDKYDKNKILDLQKVNRCMNNRFCPNCKKLDVSKFIHKFRNIVVDYKEYNYYFLTLTVPNCTADNLSFTLDKLNKCFSKFKKLLSFDMKSKESFKERILTIDGGIRVLEINYNGVRGYHPHLHCVVLCKNVCDKMDLEKRNLARYSKKRKAVDYKSNIEVQIGKLWSMLWNDEKISIKRYNEINYLPSENEYEEGKKVLEVDFEPFSERGVYEVFKYTFKDKDIVSYNVFKTLYLALSGRRIRQGFGCLYNVKVEDIEIGEQQELVLDIDEDPEELLVREINELLTTYENYKKLSRFNTYIDNNIE